ncbi:hypothetical protein ACHAW5_010490 [Stephanodiscus triporus]|uniref:Shikimate dehydrogenase (NADP(+)) n=1 Tax=Stephanodiscus triporus TaxID=2934178 RepID=A0ABD3N566_9STRA
MSMLMEEESSCSEEEDEGSVTNRDDDDEEEAGDTDPGNAVSNSKPVVATVPASGRAKNKGGSTRLKKQQLPNSNKARNEEEDDDEEEEDLDAILFDMNIHTEQKEHQPTADTANARSSSSHTSLRALLLSKERGFDVQDLDLNHAMRSLIGVGGVVAGVGGGDAMIGDDGFGVQPQPQQRGRGGRRRYTLARKFLFGRPRPEWGKPPSFVGGGLGTKEVTTGMLNEDRRASPAPWPYNLLSGKVDDDGGSDTTTTSANPAIATNQRWYTIEMADTYQQHNKIYQDLLSLSSSPRHDGGGLHDPNLLAMFVADHPYFVETVLQLAMVLYYVNDRTRGHDLLRRCIFLYESVLPASVLPGGDGGGDDDREVLIDINRNQLNSGYFATLFRIMQTSGMSGWYDNALATGRYLLSLDPQRDPMGILLILDYYALASRRRHRRPCMSPTRHDGRSTTIATNTKEVDAGAAFIVDLIESNLIFINHKDPLTDRHLSCRLVDMPNWAFSYALALYRLYECYEDGRGDDYDTLDFEEGDPRRIRAAADDALVQALSRFPGVLSKLLVAMNIVENNAPGRYSFRSGSSSIDWSIVLPSFNDAAKNDIHSDEHGVARASGEHLINIFVGRCHNLWKEEGVIRWLYQCAERAASGGLRCHNQQQKKSPAGKMNYVSLDVLDEEKERKPVSPSQPQTTMARDASVAAASTSDADDGKASRSSIPPRFVSKFSPALARYAQCDPSEYEDSFRTFPPEAIGLDPNVLAPAMVALGPNNGGRRRFFRQGQRQLRDRIGAGEGEAGGGRDPFYDALRRMLPEDEILDPDSPLLQLYLQSLLPWTHGGTTTVPVRRRYDGDYDRPIVLLGLSSSPRNDELRRLAISLSGSLAGDDPRRLRDAMDALGRSQGAGMLGDDDDDENDENGGGGGIGVVGDDGEVAGIALSAVGVDDEGPFVLDAGLIGDLVRDGTMSLATGVVVVDFNHHAFASSHGDEVDLIRALGSVARRLHEEEGLVCVYVNVDPDDDETMGRDARERKRTIEREILIPFSDYELCIKNEGIVDAAGGRGADPRGDEEDEKKSSSISSSSSSSSWADVEWELRRIIARALLPPPAVGETGAPNSADLVMGKNTFFLSLSFPRVEDASPYVERLCEDVDSMEYRVDLLDAAREYRSSSRGEDGGDPRFEILYQQQRLRSLCRPHARRAPALPFAGSGIIDDALPIVYTVRTAHQAGTWPDDDDGIRQMFDLLELGLRSAAEVLDVESAWDDRLTSELLTRARERYTSLILGSHHVVGTEVTMEEAVELYRQCRMKNRAHGAKVVLSINSNDNDEDQLAYRASIAASKLDKPEIPNIGLVLGEIGSYSRILNTRFTPVTHECLPVKAAPGQLTAAEIMAGRVIMGMIPAQRYAILGHNIAYSVSPQMQGSAFAAVKLPHTYSRADVETVEEFVEGPIWNDDNFGGCSVTVPHKQSIIPHVDVLTDAAKEIGSVNTVIVKKDRFGKRVLIGDNTDWRGIYNPLKRRLGDDNGVRKGKTRYALILGGGGTARAAAYAASKLGLERIYFNRTPEKAIDLAAEFGGIMTSSLDDNPDVSDSLGALLSTNYGSVEVVISTLPAAVGFQLPEWMLSGDDRRLPHPVIFDVNYKPYDTALLLQASGMGFDFVRGSEMLWEQGVGQFELWTGRTAPYGVMKRVVLDNCLPSDDGKK